MILNLRKRAARSFALLLMLAVTVGYVPQIAAPVYAADGAPVIVEEPIPTSLESKNTSILHGTANTYDAQTVWYAGKPWRVIYHDNKGNGEVMKNPAASADYSKVAMTLFSVESLGSSSFKDDHRIEKANYYDGSDLQAAVHAIYENEDIFSAKEKEAVIQRTLNTDEYADGKVSNGIAGPAAENEDLWPLSSAEARVLPDDGGDGRYSAFRQLDPDHPDWQSSIWWLRSPGKDIPSTGTTTGYIRSIAYVEGHGIVQNENGDATFIEYQIRPAFHMDLRTILFESAAVGGKDAEELTAVDTKANDEWKLTLLDDGSAKPDGWDAQKYAVGSDHADFAIDDSEPVTLNPETGEITVPYTGAATGDNEFISAIVKDENGNITHYGRVMKAAASTGEVSFNIDGKVPDGSTLYVFNEQCNGDYNTDYASALKEVTIPKTIAVKAVHIEAAGELYDGLTGKLPAGADKVLSEDGKAIYISYPADSSVTNGSVIKMLEEVLSGIEEYYDGEHNPCLVGYKSTYESSNEYKAEKEANQNKPIETGQVFYVLWEKPIETADITVKVLKCGDEVKGDPKDNQDPKPVAKITGEGIDSEQSTCYWWSGPTADKDKTFVGTANYDEDLYVLAGLSAKFGYYFAGPGNNATEVSVNGKDESYYRSAGTGATVVGKVQVEHNWGEWKVTKKATTTSEGLEERTCIGDPSHKETRAIPKLDPESSVTPGSDSSNKVSGLLLAKMKAKGSKSLVITWNRISGADGYDIFFARCSGKDRKEQCKKIKSISGNKTLKFTKKGLKKGKAYKAVVKAYVIKNGKKTYVKTSPMVHAYASGADSKRTNAKAVKVKKANVSLKKGKTFKIRASVVKLKKGKKLMSSGHDPKLRYISSNTRVATVSKSGKIKAKARGTCKIYVLAVNGAKKAVKVTVR